MKNITELTEIEAKEILKFVYPDVKEYERYFTGLSFEPVISEDGMQQITFTGRSIIGIKYHNAQDNCLLHFDNHKVILWLYKNGYDITDFLESVQNDDKIINKLKNFMFNIYFLVNNRQEQLKKNDKEHMFSLEYVIKNLKEALDKYFKQ
jgi:hypothetical protein